MDVATLKAKIKSKQLPPAWPEAKTNANGDWVILNKDKILKAGMEGREVDFRIGGAYICNKGEKHNEQRLD